MRRHSTVCFVGASLLLGACSGSDRASAPTGPAESPESPSFATSTTTGPVCGNYPAKQATAIQQILTELGYVYPRFSPPLIALQVVSNLLGVALAKAQQTPAQQFAVQIINRLQSDLKAGKLQNPPQPNLGNFTTKDQVVDDLVKRLQCLTALPVTGNSPDAGVGVVTPNAPATIVTGSQTGGASFPAGSVNNTTVVTVQRLPDGPQLLTSLHQFPEFFEITSSNPNAQIVQQNKVIVGICNVADNTGNPSLLIAHFVDQLPTGTNFGDVEVLPPVTAAFLDCSTVIGSATAKPRNFAAASWRAVSNGLGSFAKTLFLPAELHATILLGGGPGGFTGKFSPFGTVDINSNPATLSIVSPAGGFVSGPGNVSVKATSAGSFSIPGNPIPGVPVSFGAAVVTTGPDGIATFNWTTAAQGATLTATVPNEDNCPSGPDGPVTVAYRPKVCFTPSSVTFTFKAPDPPLFGAAGWTYTFATGTCTNGPSSTTPATVFGAAVNIGTDDCRSGIQYPAGWPNGDLSALTTWLTGTAPFGNVVSVPSPSGCQADIRTTGWAAQTVLLLRRDFFVPQGTTSATIQVSIDNDVQIYLNGTPLTGSANSLVLHDGCASIGSPFTFVVPVGQGGLQIGNNKLAVEALDRGGDTFFDAQITLQTN